MSEERERDQDADRGNLDPIESEFDELDDDDSDSDELTDEFAEDWGGGELEEAYMRALSALEASESEFRTPDVVTSPSDESDSETTEVDSDDSAENLAAETEHVERVGNNLFPEVTSDPDDLLASEVVEAEVQERISEQSRNTPATSDSESFGAATLPPTPRQIIEACLFVGGTALTSKKLSGILRGEFDSEFVDREIDSLNRQYAAERRPYEIRLSEGGYRLTLREEFERIRYKVYGLGPKEVRLSQDALEVLAVVAYHQPIKQARIEELGKPGCGAVLRQLVRRELIAVERDPAHPREVNYKTTARFLSLFGIRNLDELPRHEQVSYK